MSKNCEIKKYIEKLPLSQTEKERLNNIHNAIGKSAIESKAFRLYEGRIYARKFSYNKAVQFVSSINKQYNTTIAKLVQSFPNQHTLSVNVTSLSKEIQGKLFASTNTLSSNQIQYTLKAINALEDSKVREPNKNFQGFLNDLRNVPKDQLILIKNTYVEGMSKKDLIASLLANYNYTVEINTAKSNIKTVDYVGDDFPMGVGFVDEVETEELNNTNYYANLTVPGGTNYTENEIATPLITPSIKGHAQFATDKGIGWFRSDDKINKYSEKLFIGADGYNDYFTNPRTIYYNEIAIRIINNLPKIKEGYKRFWRGSRLDEIGNNTIVTDSLVGIALPFMYQYNGEMTYVDVPIDKYRNYVQKGATAKDSEFLLPDSYKDKFNIVNRNIYKDLENESRTININDKRKNFESKQFQKLTAEEKAKTIEQVTKEHRSIAALKDLSAKFAHRIGGTVKFENNPNADWKGYNRGMTSVLNEAYMTPDTPFHEVLAHPIIRAIKNRDSNYELDKLLEQKRKLEKLDKNTNLWEIGDNWVANQFQLPFRATVEWGLKEINNKVKYLKKDNLYQSLLKELETGRGKEVFEQVKRDYARKENVYPYKAIYADEITEKYIKDNPESFKTMFLGKYQIYSKTLNTWYIFTNEEGTIKTDLTAKELSEFINKNTDVSGIVDLFDDNIGKYTLEEQQEEAIVTLLGLMAADKLDAKKDATLISKLKELWKQISDFVKSLLRQDGIKIDELPITTTLNDLAEIMAYGNNKIILPGYKVEYSTPLGNKYDTLEEVNNEIRGLADANVEVDLSGVKIPESKDIKNVEDIPVDSFMGVDGRLYEKQKDGWKLIRDKVENDGIKRYYEPVSGKNILFQYNSKDGWFDGSDFTRGGLEGFLEKNKEYEQSKEIIEQWKKENNIKYDPEEIYSRGQGFYSSIGAYSNLELDLLLKNLIQHIQDNKKASENSLIKDSDKIIFGHPGIGKTHLKESGRKDIIDFDSDYKSKINKQFNLPEGFKARNDFQKSNKEEYQEAVRKLWVEAKNDAKRTGKKLFASDMILLREFSNDFDKVITMSKETFVNRAKQRNDYTPGLEGTEGWKNNLDKEIGKIDKSKVHSTDKYLSDLLDSSNYGFTISAFTKPIDKRLKHIEGTGDRVRFVIYPKSEHIKWAAPTDVYSGSVWDANTKVSTDKKSELLGVSYTKSPSINNVNKISPNLSEIIDSLEHVHNELAIELTMDNFEIEFDENIDYSTKQLINSVNKIIQQKRLQSIENKINQLEKQCN